MFSKSFNSNDVFVMIDDEVVSTELSPLLDPNKAAPVRAVVANACAATILWLPSDVWVVILRYLSFVDAIALRRANSVLRQRLNRALCAVEHVSHRNNLLTVMNRRKNTYLEGDRFKAQRRNFYLKEIALTEIACVLTASISINSFQVPYLSAFQNMSQAIMNEGSVNVTWRNGLFGSCAARDVNWQLPEICNFNCFSDKATDAPAGYWFVGFLSANAAYISLRATMNIPLNKYPIRKLTAGLLSLSFAGLAVSLPLLANQGWAETAGIKAACCLTEKCRSYQIPNPCNGTYTYAIASFCFNSIDQALPLIPALAEISPLILSGIGVASLLGVGLWALKKRNEFITEKHQVDPNAELDSDKHKFKL